MTADPDVSVRRSLIANAVRAPELLIELARDSDPALRQEVLHILGVEAVPADFSAVQALRLLARSGHEAICAYVAKHPNTPVPCLWDLTLSRFPTVRFFAGMNSALGIEGQLALAADGAPEVRRRLAKSPHVDLSVLERLLCDPNPTVQETASGNKLIEGDHRLKLAADMASEYEGRPYTLAEALEAILE